MRFLGIGDTCDLGALYLRLSGEGHEVKVSIAEPLAEGTMAGMIQRSLDWRQDLDWVRQAGGDGIILFENVDRARGSAQDELRQQGLNVIGGSAFGDRLENDRAYAQQVLSSVGFRVAKVREFSSAGEGLEFLRRHPARYVLKFNGAGLSSSDNYVGRVANGADVAAVLHAKRSLLDDRKGGFILMQHVEGIEMGVGAYFDGQRFIEPACLDWEHKRFFPGDLGELTGEMGTVVTYDRTHKFFSHTLRLMSSLLRQHGYCGYINLNTIVNEGGVWPLEFTCRFGYPGFAVLTPLQETTWSQLFASMIKGQGKLVTRRGYSVGIVLTTPPFPYDRKAVDEAVGFPVLFDGELTREEREHLHYGEVGLANGTLVTTGCYGWTMVVTGIGETIADAQCRALELARRVYVPNLRYRQDIGDKLVSREWQRLERLGWLD